MRGFAFFNRVSRAFHDYPSVPKVLVVVAVSGCGLVAYAEANPERKLASSAPVLTSAEVDNKKKKVVVLGTGWAGTSFLRNLKNPDYEVHVISPRNYFAFTPLLPSVTCGTVEARSIVEPIRNIARKKTVDVQFSEAACLKIDAVNQKIYCRSNVENNLNGQEEFVVDYDYLIVAVGANVNTFNTPGVVENCHFLKEVEDAQKIRRTVIDCFERASLPAVSDEERKRILHFAIVGGGPTGVEFAAALHDFVNEDLVKLYPGVKDLVKITLLEAGDHILNMFDKRITAFAEEKFQRDGINVKTGSMVVKVTEKEIFTKELKNGGEVSTIPYGMALWSTGVGTRPFIRDFMSQVGQANRRVLATDEWLRVEGCDKVYAIGDCATINQRKVMVSSSAGLFEEQQMKNMVDLLKETPDVSKGSAELNIEDFKTALSKACLSTSFLISLSNGIFQVAAQQGVYLAKCFNRMEDCEKNPEGPLRFRGEGRHRFRPFRYKHLGQFAPLGGEQTAAQLPGDWVSIGHSSQWLWYSVYTSKQVSWRNRALVVTDWVRRFIWGRDSSRI
ncbi:external alternative NAD(P)H-ubiquinone oxidoreductase B3 mitochondrial [Prunus yedoensis var. nudiflora]|uniref:NADH:ubiquinone reductase (non-electrogenic) n=1 Tax=Prunus yedoensis var. nudiflora TaxID=2094558 RepID=A0A314YBF4_PRUYE|nr:external alternative NAD(P)H-ubiquinone oxidoreductase B3 mitochondrial [Prunus yedoensis var. nudiflora]